MLFECGHVPHERKEQHANHRTSQSRGCRFPLDSGERHRVRAHVDSRSRSLATRHQSRRRLDNDSRSWSPTCRDAEGCSQDRPGVHLPRLAATAGLPAHAGRSGAYVRLQARNRKGGNMTNQTYEDVWQYTENAPDYATIRQTLAAALWLHHENRAEYTGVMSGTF